MLAPFLLLSSITCCLPCDLPLPRLQSLCHQCGMRGPGSDVELGAPMGALLTSLSFPGGLFLQHLLAQERGKGCLGMEDHPPRKSVPRHARCQSVCLSLGNPSQPCTPCLCVLVYLPRSSIPLSAPIST